MIKDNCWSEQSPEKSTVPFGGPPCIADQILGGHLQRPLYIRHCLLLVLLPFFFLVTPFSWNLVISVILILYYSRLESSSSFPVLLYSCLFLSSSFFILIKSSICFMDLNFHKSKLICLETISLLVFFRIIIHERTQFHYVHTLFFYLYVLDGRFLVFLIYWVSKIVGNFEDEHTSQLPGIRPDIKPPFRLSW